MGGITLTFTFQITIFLQQTLYILWVVVSLTLVRGHVKLCKIRCGDRAYLIWAWSSSNWVVHLQFCMESSSIWGSVNFNLGGGNIFRLGWCHGEIYKVCTFKIRHEWCQFEFGRCHLQFELGLSSIWNGVCFNFDGVIFSLG